MKKGDLVRWSSEYEVAEVPCIITRGPREGYVRTPPSGYLNGSALTEIVMIVDILVDGKIIRNIPLSEIHPWVIESS